MKTKQTSKQIRAQGSVLVISMTILAVGAIVLASYLTLVETQTNAVARSQTWNSAIAMTEAGVEEGLAEINKNSPTDAFNTSPWSWTNSVASDGWSTYTNGATSLTRYLSTSSAGTNGYTVTISVTGTTSSPTITSAGFVAFSSVLWGSAGAPQSFLAGAGVSTTGSTTLNRKVVVSTVLSPLFSVAIVTRSNFNMNGNGATVDSFDSSNTNYSTAGQWTASQRKANGSIATDSAIVGDISLGNGNIYGHVYTGPGTAQSAVQIGPNGAVGDLNWQAGSTGIESGYWAGNFNTTIPDVAAPTYVGSALPAPAASGTYKGDIVLNGGQYTVTASGAPTATLVITAPTTLWVQGSFSPPALIFTNGASTTGSLVLYVGTANSSGSDSISLGGNGTMNSPGYAANLEIFGLPSVKTLTLTGNSAMIAAIYAPDADFSGKGGGNNMADTAGAMVVNSVTLKGHWNFHYDENLANSGASRGWIAKNWTEVAPH